MAFENDLEQKKKQREREGGERERVREREIEREVGGSCLHFVKHDKL